jgi:hypothetical protein
MRTSIRLVVFAAALAGAALGMSCSGTDVVGKVAAASFKAAAEASEGRVSFDGASGTWTLASPAGDRFLLSADLASAAPDAAFVLDAAPFLAAGLDPAKLAGGAGVPYSVADGLLTVAFELGTGAATDASRTSLPGAFDALLAARRELVGYHQALDHYGIKLGGGNMFEWAKDLAKNDKDLVWVLDPAPFVAAGVDPAKVEGWVFAAVEMMEDGKKISAEKLLKPFDLR